MNDRALQLSRAQLQKLRKQPRNRSVWRSLNVRLASTTQVYVSNTGVRLVRTGSSRSGY